MFVLNASLQWLYVKEVCFWMRESVRGSPRGGGEGNACVFAMPSSRGYSPEGLCGFGKTFMSPLRGREGTYGCA